jgi:hypothetical protein
LLEFINNNPDAWAPIVTKVELAWLNPLIKLQCAPMCPTVLYHFTLSNSKLFYLSKGECQDTLQLNINGLDYDFLK